MNKITKQLLTGTIALGLLAPVATSSLNPIKTTVNAKRHHKRHVQHQKKSAWKHYAPKSIRGFWLAKHHHETWGLSFQNRGVAFNPNGAAIQNWNKPQYKYDGRGYYSIKPSQNSHNTANYLGKHSRLRYYIETHAHTHISVWIKGYTGGYKYIGNYHKVSRRTFLS